MSRLTRDDFEQLQRRNMSPEAPLCIKEIERQQLGDQIAEFLARGGRIQRIGEGVTGDETKAGVFNPSPTTKRAQMRSEDAIGITVAAAMLQISRTLLSKWCKAGAGPKNHSVDGKLRFLLVDIEAYKIDNKEKAAA